MAEDISSDIFIDQPLAAAWRLWTTDSGLESWLTPEAHIDLRLQGSYELFFNPKDHSDNNTSGCRIIALIPQRLLAFEWKGPSSLAVMNFNPLPTWVSVSFEAVEPNKTIMHFRHGGWGSGAEWQAAHDWFQSVWTNVLQTLQSVDDHGKAPGLQP